MSEWTFAILWCAAQVTIVSTAALVVAWIVMERRPEFAAATAGWAAVVAVAATLLVPFQMPRLRLPSDAEFRPEVANIAPNDGQRTVATNTQTGRVPPAGTSGFVFDLASVLRKTSGFRQSLPPASVRMGRYAAIGLCLAAVVGLAKCVLAFVLLSGLRRRAEPICDGEFDALAEEIVSQLGGLPPVAFAESPEIGSAAVVGVIRPTVLVSRQWRSWMPGERRAVVAHELAHIRRRDAAWRLAATVCAALHLYNPLFRWLFRRLVLAQELAADRLAVAAAGGQGDYLRALSQLAIRQDAWMGPRPEPLSTPVFTGHLMRRLEMLRAMDCEQDRSPRRWHSYGVIASIVLFGIATTAMRGFAQTSEPNESIDASETREAASTDVGEIRDVARNSTFFQREGFPATHPSFGQQGALYINIGALTRSEPLSPILEGTVIDELLPKELAEMIGVRDLRSFTTDVRTWVTKEKRAGFAVGGRGFGLQTAREMDWKAAIAKQFPEYTEGMRHGFEYLQVALPSMEPLSIRLRPVGPRELTMALAGPPGVGDEWHIRHQEQPNPPWSKEWQAVSGGVLSFVMTNPESTTLPSFEHRIGADQRRLIYQATDLMSIGVDVSDEARLVRMKVRLRCEESAKPDQVRAAVRQLIALHKNKMDVQLVSTSGNDVIDRMSSDALDSANIRLVPGTPAVIECNLQFALPPDLLMQLAAKREERQSAPSEKQTPEKSEASNTRR